MHVTLLQITQSLQKSKSDTSQPSSNILQDLITAAGIVPDSNQDNQSGEVTLNLDESQLVALTSAAQDTTQTKGFHLKSFLVMLKHANSWMLNVLRVWSSPVRYCLSLTFSPSAGATKQLLINIVPSHLLSWICHFATSSHCFSASSYTSAHYRFVSAHGVTLLLSHHSKTLWVQQYNIV